jgi:DNA-binding transcriptional ArsR family regulator
MTPIEAPPIDEPGETCSTRVDLDSTGSIADWKVECVTRLFSALGDPTRFTILCVLISSDGMKVGDLASHAGLSVSAVSHQLRLLRDRNLVVGRRQGRMIFYSLADDHVRTLIETAMQHAVEDCPNRPRNKDLE